MSLSQRVKRLRDRSLAAVPSLSSQRAEILTDYYSQNSGTHSIPEFRARSFAYLLNNIDIYIGKDELIVGEKGPLPKASPTYPELCCHSLDDLDTLNSREKIPFKVDQTTRAIYSGKITPFWHGKSMREKLFNNMLPSWIDSYNAGIFTEFMEQRAPGHTVLDGKIYHTGILDFIQKIETSLNKLDNHDDPLAGQKRNELFAMRIAGQAIMNLAERYAAKADELAEIDPSIDRKVELKEIARICRKVPANAPSSFHEALQYYWFVHLGVTLELNTWDALSPGRLDQHLVPFYRRDIAAGNLTSESAEELLQCFWIKFNNQPAPPKVGVTAAESGTYTDFAQINLGGLQEDGSDGVNEVTYLLLNVVEEMRLLQPSASIQVSNKSPDEFMIRAAKIIRTGFGQPSIFNTDCIIQEMLNKGKSLTDARNGGTSGCVETGAFGKENYSLTGYFNLPKVLEITLHNGIDPASGKLIGLQTGIPQDIANYQELFTAFQKQVEHFVAIKIEGNRKIEQLYARDLPSPFLSIFIDDCVIKGLDYNQGGARYNIGYIQGVGIGSITDTLSAIKTHVFKNDTFSLTELLQILRVNFVGFERERQLLLNRTPKYGNDIDEADDIMEAVFSTFHDAVTGKKNTRDGIYAIDMLPTTSHVYFGSVLGATADGRFAGKPVSEGISPVQSADRKGPTAVLKSAGKMDHIKTGGTLLNQKFSPSLLKDDKGIMNMIHLVRTYFKMNGHHIQFNVVDAKTLKDAKEHPSLHRDLIVRVAGYSDYFCDLSDSLQDEIIERTEHSRFA